MKYFRYWRATFLLLISILFLNGCNKRSETTTFWIVTENTGQYGMNTMTELLMEEFQKTHENVEFKLDILPGNGEERASRLEKLRVEIMSGQGPDLYLLPSSSYLKESLFPDVNLSMYNGFFTDVSAYYDADESLGKESLKTAVMNAGVVDDARYILPLRFDMPAFYVDKAAIEETGMNLEVFEQGINQVYEEIQRLDSQTLACGADFEYDSFGLNVYSDLVDYAKNEVLLSKEEVVNFLKNFQANTTLIGDEYTHFTLHDIYSYVVNGFYWGNGQFPMFSTGMNLQNAMTLAAIGKVAEKELLMYPMRAMDGTVNAEVVYWGAVGADCKNPELAYDFLRLFLLEDAQWEQNTAKIYKEVRGFMGSGWPVRTKGSAQALWNIYREQYRGVYRSGEEGWTVRNAKLLELKLSNDDIPLLDAEIDVAQFTTDFETQIYAQLLFELNDSVDGTPTDVTLEAAAEELIEQLTWYISEG